MGKAQLSVAETAEMFRHVADHIEANVDRLTQADQAIGDGDHGVGMARGLAVARQKLATQPPDTVAEVLRAVGMALLSATGGAAGAIFGTLFRGGAQRLEGVAAFDAPALALFLEDGLQAVQERGHAALGDKTMVDALAPASAQARALAGQGLDAALAGAAAAARKGMEATRDMLPAMGKAWPLGERARGHVDPGALSMFLILEAMAEYAMGCADIKGQEHVK
jgi:dihydroxyacetone kinase-like protein